MEELKYLKDLAKEINDYKKLSGSTEIPLEDLKKLVQKQIDAAQTSYENVCTKDGCNPVQIDPVSHKQRTDLKGNPKFVTDDKFLGQVEALDNIMTDLKNNKSASIAKADVLEVIQGSDGKSGKIAEILKNDASNPKYYVNQYSVTHKPEGVASSNDNQKVSDIAAAVEPRADLLIYTYKNLNGKKPMEIKNFVEDVVKKMDGSKDPELQAQVDILKDWQDNQLDKVKTSGGKLVGLLAKKAGIGKGDTGPNANELVLSLDVKIYGASPDEAAAANVLLPDAATLAAHGDDLKKAQNTMSSLSNKSSVVQNLAVREYIRSNGANGSGLYSTAGKAGAVLGTTATLVQAGAEIKDIAGTPAKFDADKVIAPASLDEVKKNHSGKGASIENERQTDLSFIKDAKLEGISLGDETSNNKSIAKQAKVVELDANGQPKKEGRANSAA